MSPTIARTRADFDAWRSEVDRVAVVLTMGALHEGHASLVRLAQKTGLPVVLTVFVNPMQFAAGEDLERYPRTEDHDLKLAETLGVECVWLPEIADVYPSVVEPIEPGALGEVLEGAARPGHFTGVLTVVHRFFDMIRPDVAVFGKKDRQQLILIEKMVAELELGIEIVRAETVRENDGLAMSSRNRYLDSEQRVRARVLSTALRTAAEAGRSGSVERVRKSAQDLLGGIDLDYLVVTDAHLNEVSEGFCGPAIVLVAARIGSTRLIDNVDVEVSC